MILSQYCLFLKSESLSADRQWGIPWCDSTASDTDTDSDKFGHGAENARPKLPEKVESGWFVSTLIFSLEGEPSLQPIKLTWQTLVVSKTHKNLACMLTKSQSDVLKMAEMIKSKSQIACSIIRTCLRTCTRADTMQERQFMLSCFVHIKLIEINKRVAIKIIIIN